MANLSAFGGAQPITPGGLVELGYTERTTDFTTTQTAFSSAAANNLFASDLTVVCDGGPILVEFFSRLTANSTATAYGQFGLNVDGVENARCATSYGSQNDKQVYFQRRITPSAGTHTFNVCPYSHIASTLYVYGGTGGPGVAAPMFLRVSKIVQQSDGLKPFWTPPITASLPSNPDTGDQIVYKHGATGNIGSHLPMIYDGTKWQPMGEAILCRWNCGAASQVFSSTSITNVTVGDYNTVTFTPPWNGYYEISQRTEKWELNSGIGMRTYFSSTDGAENYKLHYVEDWNGPYQHHREGHGQPVVYYLSASKTYRFAALLTYAAGNTGTIHFEGTSHVRALSR